MSSAGSAQKLAPFSEEQPISAGNLRGAAALIKAANLAGAKIPAGEAPTSGRDLKTVKKADRLLKQAIAAMDDRRHRVSEALFDQALALLKDPPPRLWCYRLVAASKASNYEYVVNNYERVRALASCEEEAIVVDRAWIDCLSSAGYFHEALRVAETVADRSEIALTSIKTAIGVINAKLGNHEMAIAIQKQVLEQDPTYVLARWNLAFHQLEVGHIPEAFDNYEARWDWTDFPSERRTFDIPRWQGESLDGKRILVWREQGIGDEIRFSGILPDLIATGARITLECSPKLVPLFRLSFPETEIRSEKIPRMRKGKDYAGFDFEVPIGSLARQFRPTVAQMQAKCRPWLSRDAEIESRFRADMNVSQEQPVIGLCWRSANRNVQRNQHYINAEYLTPLKLLGRAKFVCLQYDECRDEVAAMREMGLPIYDFPSINQMNDLVSASYLTGACDLVISAPTAVAELSAGLGVPTIMFGLPKSHVQLGTDGVPWHPASRYLPLNPDEPMEVAKSILFSWKEIAAWAEKSSISGRRTDWRLAFPGAA